MDFVDQIKAEILRKIYRYWRGKCREGALPSRADLDPIDIPALLAHVFLIDVVDGGRDFRYRLLGTHIVESVGFEFTGQLVSEFMRDTRRNFWHRTTTSWSRAESLST